MSQPVLALFCVPGKQEMGTRPRGLISTTQLFMLPNLLGLASLKGGLFCCFILNVLIQFRTVLRKKLRVRFRPLCSLAPRTDFLGPTVQRILSLPTPPPPHPGPSLSSHPPLFFSSLSAYHSAWHIVGIQSLNKPINV